MTHQNSPERQRETRGLSSMRMDLARVDLPMMFHVRADRKRCHPEMVDGEANISMP